MANRFPSFPAYPNDWLGSKARALMSPAARAAYWDLLFHYWEGGCKGLDSCQKVLRSLALQPELSDQDLALVVKQFKKRRGKLHNAKLQTLYREKVAYFKASSENGKKGAEKRWGSHSNPNGPPIDSPLAENDSSSSSSSSSSTSSSSEDKDRGAAIAALAVDTWNKDLNPKSHIRVTPKRVAKARSRLKDKFSEEQLLSVAQKLRDSEWHMGGNDRGWRASGPEWVWHTTERVEEWLNKDGSSSIWDWKPREVKLD